jgi:hypothetical protein
VQPISQLMPGSMANKKQFEITAPNKMDIVENMQFFETKAADLEIIPDFAERFLKAVKELFIGCNSVATFIRRQEDFFVNIVEILVKGIGYTNHALLSLQQACGYQPETVLGLAEDDGTTSGRIAKE